MYATDKSKDNKYLYVWYRGVYSARIFGFCIIRNKKTFNQLK